MILWFSTIFLKKCLKVFSCNSVQICSFDFDDPTIVLKFDLNSFENGL